MKSFLLRAISLAKRGKRTFPNPRVGCVLVKDGRIVGEGWHDYWSGPHAEAVALKKAGAKARGATAYVTLEPCCAHPGKKTPPCSNALVKAGIASVVACLRDTNPGVNGGGLRILRRAGVRVRTGLFAKQARALNVPVARTRVILKTALSLDGFAKTANGRSRWISSAAARRDGHRLRAQVDAILVGVGTVLGDDPLLTSHGMGRNPVRVVLDSRGRTPRRAKVLDGSVPTWIFTASRKTFPNAEAIRVPLRGGRIDALAVLRELAQRRVRTVLVEGGPTIHAAFLAAGLVDEARVYLAPKLLAGASDPNTAPRLAAPKLEKVGTDFLFRGKLTS